MRRKLVQQGPSTLMVSLPSKWIKEQNLKKGEEVSIEQNENKLLISAQDIEKTYEKRSINLEEIPRLTDRIINSSYRKGIDELTLTFPNSRVFGIIQKSLHEVVGFEIVEQKERSCTLKSVSSSTIEEFDIMLRRMFLMLLEMTESTLNALSNKEFNRLNEVKLLESTNNRFSAFCRRLLNKEIYSDQRKTIQLYIISRDLEKIADQYKHICSYAQKNKVKLTKNTTAIFRRVNSYVRDLYNLYYHQDLKRVQEFVQKRDRIVASSLQLIEKENQLKQKNTKIIHNLMNVTQLSFDLSSQVLVLIL